MNILRKHSSRYSSTADAPSWDIEISLCRVPVLDFTPPSPLGNFLIDCRKNSAANVRSTENTTEQGVFSDILGSMLRESHGCVPSFQLFTKVAHDADLAMRGREIERISFTSTSVLLPTDGKPDDISVSLRPVFRLRESVS